MRARERLPRLLSQVSLPVVSPRRAQPSCLTARAAEIIIYSPQEEAAERQAPQDAAEGAATKKRRPVELPDRTPQPKGGDTMTTYHQCERVAPRRKDGPRGNIIRR